MKSILLGFGLGVAAGMFLTKNKCVQRVVSDTQNAVKEKFSSEQQPQSGSGEEELS